jgi:(R,R)-butanediol dehydrogenase/meso-butanediol dehydrogenase/diacetyl reductase
LADGALLEPLACALHSVKLAGWICGSRVLVLGAGALGLATAFWARRLGATRLVVSARSPRNQHLALAMGAAQFLATGELDTALTAALGGPPDVVFECVGAPAVIDKALELVRPRGTVIIAGACPVADVFRPLKALLKEARLQGAFGFNLQELQTAADAFDHGATEPRAMITQTVSLQELPAAFEALRHPTVQCKLMVDPWA